MIFQEPVIQKKFSVSIDGKSIVIPEGVHSYQAELIRKLAKNQALLKRYAIAAEDLQQFFHPARRVNNVGDQLTMAILQQAVASKKRELSIF